MPGEEIFLNRKLIVNRWKIGGDCPFAEYFLTNQEIRQGFWILRSEHLTSLIYLLGLEMKKSLSYFEDGVGKIFIDEIEKSIRIITSYCIFS